MSIRRQSAGTAAAHEAVAERSVASTQPPSVRTRSAWAGIRHRLVRALGSSRSASPSSCRRTLECGPLRRVTERTPNRVRRSPRCRRNKRPGPHEAAVHPARQRGPRPHPAPPVVCGRRTCTPRACQEHDAQNETHRGSRSARNAEIPERGAARKDHRHPDADGRGRHHPRAGVDGVLLVFDRAELARLFFAVAVVGVLALARRRRGDGKSVLLVAHGILVAVCGIALIDAPIAWVPRSAHMFLLPLAAAAAFIFEARERYGLSLRRSTSTDRSPRPGRSGR